VNQLKELDRKLIEATQAGLPIIEAPYASVAAEIGTTETEVIDRFGCLIEQGIVRRIAAAPNHYALGMNANGMTVWDIDDQFASQKGCEVGALDFVSHCYLRPRVLQEWPFNLFAMVHGRNRQEVESKRSEIAQLLGETCRRSDVLYSTRILKKTGLRLSLDGG
jgi:DNA-binding Lrp family transcriptional regulator